jgi:hypothetical protein
MGRGREREAPGGQGCVQSMERETTASKKKRNKRDVSHLSIRDDLRIYIV